MNWPLWFCDPSPWIEVAGLLCIFSGVGMAVIGQTVFWHTLGAGIFGCGILFFLAVWQLRRFLLTNPFRAVS